MTYLLLPEIQIQNVNALSSLCTIGFPAMTAWMGAVHALERKVRLTESLREVRFISLGVISHESRLQVYKNPGDYHYSIAISSNPLRKREEIHLNVRPLSKTLGSISKYPCWSNAAAFLPITKRNCCRQSERHFPLSK